MTWWGHCAAPQLAKHRDISVNRLVEELATISIAEFVAETRFRDPNPGINFLDPVSRFDPKRSRDFGECLDHKFPASDHCCILKIANGSENAGFS